MIKIAGHPANAGQYLGEVIYRYEFIFFSQNS
jgi:hypothetical protein